MEIKDIKQLKKEVEEKIKNLIIDFTKKTTLSVSNIDYYYVSEIGTPKIGFPVDINLKLEV